MASLSFCENCFIWLWIPRYLTRNLNLIFISSVLGQMDTHINHRWVKKLRVQCQDRTHNNPTEATPSASSSPALLLHTPQGLPQNSSSNVGVKAAQKDCLGKNYLKWTLSGVCYFKHVSIMNHALSPAIKYILFQLCSIMSVSPWSWHWNCLFGGHVCPPPIIGWLLNFEIDCKWPRVHDCIW